MTVCVDLPGCVIDFSDLRLRVGDDRELLRELFTIFKQELPPLVAAMQEGFAGGDLKKAARAANALRGMLGNLSMPSIQEIGARIERASLQGRMVEAEESVAQLHDELKQAVLEVDEYLLSSKS